MKRNLRFATFGLCLLVMTACGSAPPQPAPLAPPHLSFPALQLAAAAADSGRQAYQAKRYAESAQQYERAATVTGYPGAASAWYNAACSWALAGESARALIALDKAIDAGWVSAAHMKQDSDLDSLHGTPEWAALVARVEAAQARIAAQRANIDNVKLVTADIANFWRAYDLAAAETSLVAKRAILEREYLGRASAGLLDYFFSKIRSLDRFTKFVSDNRVFYDAVRPQTLQASNAAVQIREGLRRLKELYPDARFPDVYFVIGMLTSGGTASSNGLLIGTEMYSATSSTPLDRFDLGTRRIIASADRLPNTVVHELIHSLQRGGNQTLLSGALREGVAEYLAQLAMPAPAPPYFMTWGLEHEAQVRERFLRELESRDWSQWIGNNNRATEDWPADLGYFVGYRIAEAYVRQAADRQQAIHDLIVMKDPKEILEKSGYAR